MERTAGARARIFVVASCMGRLAFVQKTAPLVVGEPELAYVLVDYSCPQGAGDWVEERFSAEVEEGRVFVVRVPGKEKFNRSAALNAGCRFAVESGASALCVVDADTLIRPGLGAFLEEQVREDSFLVAGLQEDGSDSGSLMGVLAMGAQVFEESGGFDERMQGWGVEDIDMRLRLHLKFRLPYERIPLAFLDFIDHGDELRVENAELPKEQSNLRNLAICWENVRSWTGYGMAQQSARAHRLLWQGPLPDGVIAGAPFAASGSRGRPGGTPLRTRLRKRYAASSARRGRSLG